MVGTVTISAQEPTYSNLVSKIAQRFNLKESDVQDVVNQVRSEHFSTMKTKWEERLTQAVTDGKITEAQKQAILSKQQELQNELASLKGLSPSDRKVKLQGIIADLKKWASDNKIDLKQFGFFGLRPGFGRGFRLGYKAGSM